MKHTILTIWLLASLLFATAAAAQNLALNKTATASSQVQAAANALDGNGNTRWESAASDQQYLVVDLGSVQTIDRIRLTWENAYGKNFTLDVSRDNATWTTVVTTTNNATTSNEYSSLRTSGRYVRLNGTARATSYGYSLYEFEVFTYSNKSANNLALGKPGTASSTQGGFPAAQAFDNDNTTRWGSTYNDNQWLYVDLRNTISITRLYLIWETAYGKDFRLEVSDDASNWTVVQTFANNTLHYNEVTFSPAVVGRYVRMYGLVRGTGYGFSLNEFQVYGSVVAPLPVSLLGFTATPQASGVAVKWYTATELNNAGFDVQRSADGTDFRTIAKVEGAGNSQTLKTYDYLDAAPLASTGYYRLRQLDHDGTATYGPIVAVQPMHRAPASFSVYPNPTADQATVQWEASGASVGQWQLASMTGQLLHQAAFELQPGANTQAQTIDLRAYAAGSYVLTLQVAGQAPLRQLIQKVQ